MLFREQEFSLALGSVSYSSCNWVLSRENRTLLRVNNNGADLPHAEFQDSGESQ